MGSIPCWNHSSTMTPVLVFRTISRITKPRIWLRMSLGKLALRWFSVLLVALSSRMPDERTRRRFSGFPGSERRLEVLGVRGHMFYSQNYHRTLKNIFPDTSTLIVPLLEDS